MRLFPGHLLAIPRYYLHIPLSLNDTSWDGHTISHQEQGRQPLEADIQSWHGPHMLCVRRDKPVIKKALVELEGPVYCAYKKLRQRWAIEDAYR